MKDYIEECIIVRHEEYIVSTWGMRGEGKASIIGGARYKNSEVKSDRAYVNNKIVAKNTVKRIRR